MDVGTGVLMSANHPVNSFNEDFVWIRRKSYIAVSLSCNDFKCGYISNKDLKEIMFFQFRMINLSKLGKELYGRKAEACPYIPSTNIVLITDGPSTKQFSAGKAFLG